MDGYCARASYSEASGETTGEHIDNENRINNIIYTVKIHKVHFTSNSNKNKTAFSTQIDYMTSNYRQISSD